MGNIIQEDIERLTRENPVASEQLRRIVAEREANTLKELLQNNGIEIPEEIDGNDNLPVSS
jgi:RIO-like serine/threonine protein kinase